MLSVKIHDHSLTSTEQCSRQNTSTLWTIQRTCTTTRKLLNQTFLDVKKKIKKT